MIFAFVIFMANVLGANMTVQFTFFCPNCKGKAYGVVSDALVIEGDDACYDCNSEWEKVIVNR